MEEHGRADTDGCAVHGGEERLVERRQRPGERVEVAGGGRVVLEPGQDLQVLPRREDVPGTGEHADRDRVVGRRLAECHPDCFVELAVEGVPGLGPVEGEDPDGAVVLDAQNLVVSHRARIGGPVRPAPLSAGLWRLDR